MRALTKIIDLDALRSNIVAIQNHAQNKELIAVVKANAYGHGIEYLQPALTAFDFLAVSSIEEALQLRDCGYPQTIFLLEGIFSADEAVISAENHFVICVHNHRQLNWLDDKQPFWLKVDSGMHRLGFFPHDAIAVFNDERCEGVISHFARADESDLTPTLAQLAALQPFQKKRCFSNSAAFLRSPHIDENFARIGIALYGINPNETPLNLPLKPVMTLKTEVLAIRYLTAAEKIGYGGTFSIPFDGFLATIALGYGDGFPRAIESGRVHVWIKGKLYPLVGRVAMDMSLVWLGCDTVEEGTEVIVFGEENPIETVAAAANTIPYTLTTMLTARVPTKVKSS